MNFKDLKKILPLLTPYLLVFLSYLLYSSIQENPLVSFYVIRFFAYALLLVGLAISFFFDRSRVFFTLLTLLLSQYVLVDQQLYASIAYTAVCIFIPLNVLVFTYLKERGIVSPGGKNQIGLIAAEIIFTAVIVWSDSRTLANLPPMNLFPGEINFLAVPQTAVLLFLATAITMIIRQINNVSTYENSFACVLLAAFIALNYKEDILAAAIFLPVSSLILIVAIIHDLYRKAYLDELTGIPTRRALMEELMKTGDKYAVAMLDIDHFKKFNDTYGHDVGDNALRFVAAMMKNVTGGGKVYRYGGEEFTIIFPGKGVDEALPHLEKLRDKIARRGFFLRGKDRPKKKPKNAVSKSNDAKRLFLTVSIGVAKKTERVKKAEEVLKAADNALYRAKNKGRNCVSK